MNEINFDWSELAFGSKKSLKELKAVFVAAPRELSAKRFAQIVKKYLPEGNIVLGLAKEEFIAGFEGQPQFKTLATSPALEKIISQVAAANTKHKVYTLRYFQRELKHILDKSNFKKMLLINGSWKHVFHSREEYYLLANRRIGYEMLSPFADEAEALSYNEGIAEEMRSASWPAEPKGTYTDAAMLQLAGQAAKLSMDYSFQCGVTLGKKTGGGKYRYLAHSFNKVVPFQTYALHYGASREQNFSPPHDLNHYDTVHAEVEMIVKAAAENIDLRGTTLFINLLPCPSCARMLTETPITEFVYTQDHSAGYAIQMLEKAGKTVRRIVPPADNSYNEEKLEE